MSELLSANQFFACGLTLVAFCLGYTLQQRLKLAILNPILTGAVMVGLVLTVLHIPNADYQAGTRLLSYLLTPATICLSISMYTQLQKLRRQFPAILAGVLCGSVTSLVFIYGMSQVFHIGSTLCASLLPKSLTTAIGVVLSEEMGGIGAVTTTAIIFTGILGNICGPMFSKLFRFESPVAQGVAYGTSAHVVGTARAAAISELTGAASSLSLTVAGIVTCVLLSFVM